MIRAPDDDDDEDDKARDRENVCQKPGRLLISHTVSFIGSDAFVS